MNYFQGKSNLQKFFVLTLLMIISIIAATAGNRYDDFHRVLLGVNFSPTYSYRYLKEEKGSFVGEGRNDYEIPKFGFSAGLGVCFNMNHCCPLKK